MVRSIADRVAVLENGRVAEHGTVFDIFTKPQAEVTQRFVSTVVHDRPRGANLERLRQTHQGRIVTATIADGSRLGAVLASAGSLGVTFEIVYGGIGTLQDQSFGSLTLALDGADEAVEAVVGRLREVTTIEEAS